MELKTKWDVIKRFKLFVMCGILVTVGIVVQLIIFPETMAAPASVWGVGQIPVIILPFAYMTMFFFGAAVCEDYYRCKYDNKPYLLFQKKDDMNRDIKKYPITRVWYWITGQLKE
jgi:hypothetical protein